MLAPHQLDGDVDAPVQVAERPHVGEVEAAEQAHRRCAVLGRTMQRLEEELVELAVEQRRVGECVAQDEAVAAQPWLARQPTESGTESRNPPASDEELELPGEPGGLLGVDEAHRPKAWIAGHGVAGDHSATVVADDGHPIELQEVDRHPNAADVVVDRERGVGSDATRPCAGQIDQVAGDVVDEVGQEQSEGGAADRPAVDEKDVGSLTDASVRHLAPARVEETVGRSPEHVGCPCCGDAHEGPFTKVVVVTTTR